MTEFNSCWNSELKSLSDEIRRKPLSEKNETRLVKIEECMKSIYDMTTRLKEISNSGGKDREVIPQETENIKQFLETLRGHMQSLSSNSDGAHLPVTQPKKRENLPKSARIRLKEFLESKLQYPYPTDAEKRALAKETGVREDQITNWFINARVRYWKPKVEELGWIIWQNDQGKNSILEGDRSLSFIYSLSADMQDTGVPGVHDEC